MMRSTCTMIGLGLLLPALLLPACKQGEGDRCNWNDDCSDDLVCCVTLENRVVGGVCVLPIHCDLTKSDGSVTPGDSGMDMEQSKPDSAAKDAAADQAAEQPLTPDKGASPDVTPDTAVTPDVTPDLGTTPTPDQAPADSAAE